MATRYVTLNLSVETLGREGIQALEQSVRDLAKQGGAAAPEFEQLANELTRLGDQREALTKFREIAEATGNLAERQRGAADAVAGLKQRLTELTTAADTAKTAQQAAGDAVVAQQKAVNDAAQAIRALKIETDSAGRNTQGYRDELVRLTAAQTAAKNELVELRDAQRKANQEAAAAEQAQNKVVGALARQEKSLAAANTALQANEKATQEAATAAQQLGVATDDVAASEAALVGAYNKVGAATRTLIDDTARYEAAMQEVVGEIENLDKVLRQADFDRVAAEQRALADAAGLLATEQTLAAEAAQRQNAALLDAARSAEKLAEAQRQLDAAQMVLAQEDLTRALEAQQREAQALIAVEQRLAQEQRQAADAAADAKLKMAAAAEQAAERIDAAFKTVGVRSVQEIQREIDQVRTAMAEVSDQAQRTGTNLSGAFTSGRDRINALQREIREVTGQLTLADRAANLFKNSLGQITAGNLLADGIGALVERVKDLGRQFVTTIVETETLRRGLQNVFKDSAVVAQQFDFLRQTALGAGVSVGSLQQNFVRFSASLNSANIPLQESNALFRATTNAAGALGLSGEQVSGMLEALSQIAGKGTVSLEELRQQLGDRLPGAIGLTAKGLGITEAELIKLVESGQLAARDFFPAFTRSLQTLQGEVTGLRPGFENLKTSLTSLAQESGDALWTQVLTGALKALTATVGILGGALLGITNALSVVGAAAVSLLNPIDSLRDRFGFLREQIDLAAERQARFSDTIDQALNPLQRQAEAIQAAATAQQAQQAATAQASAALVAQNTSVGETAAGLQALKLAQDASAKAAQTQQSSYISLTVELNKILAGLEVEQAALDKQAKAVDISGRAIEQLTKIRGDELASLQAGAKAAENNAAALERVAVSRQSEVEVLLTQKRALEEDLARRGLSTEQIAKETQALNDKVTTASAEVEQSQAAVRQIKAELFERELLVQAYEDNSAGAEAYARATELARRAVEDTAKAFREGKASADDLRAANELLTRSEYLLRDAVKDKGAAIQATNTLRQAELNLQVTGLGNRQKEIEQLAANAKANGDLEKAVRLEIEAKKIQIQITQLTQKAKELEAQATIQATKAEIDALSAAGQLTEVKRKELEARILNAQAKELEAKASGLVVKGLQDEIKALQDRAAAQGAVNAEIRTGAQNLRDLNAEGRNTVGTFRDIAGAAKAAAQEVKGVQLAPDGDVFSNAGRQARNDSFNNTPFQSGSGTGGALTGQAIPPTSEPGWVFVNDAKVPYTGKSNGPVLFGYWTRPQAVTGSGFSGQASLGAGGAFDITNPFGRTPGSNGVEQQRALADNTAAAADTSRGRVLVSTDTDTPGTVGTISRVPVLGKFEVEFKSDDGRTTTLFADTRDQAQDFIDHLQSARRNAGGGG